MAKDSGIASAPFLELRSVSKFFGNQEVIRNVSIALSSHDYISVMGPSGCGKSTLLHLMAGLEKPTSGSVMLAGVDLSKVPAKQVDSLRLAHCAFVFQFFHLLPALTVLENVCLPALEKGLRRPREIELRAKALLERLGLGEALMKLPQELSGGMQSRVGFARAILLEPQVLFADEPTGSLDTRSGENLLGELEAYQHESGCALVLVTHDKDAAQRARRHIRMQDGCIIDHDEQVGLI